MRTHLTGLLENLVSMGLRTSVKVLDVDTVTASQAVAAALGLAPGDPVQKAIRVRSTREGPLSHITTYVPGDVARRFGRRELSRKRSAARKSRRQVGRADHIGGRPCGSRWTPGSPWARLLAVRRLIYDEQGGPCNLWPVPPTATMRNAVVAR
jgi:GntR family transcriptional regulator